MVNGAEAGTAIPLKSALAVSSDRSGRAPSDGDALRTRDPPALLRRLLPIRAAPDT
jgi:hypothetical protein